MKQYLLLAVIIMAYISISSIAKDEEAGFKVNVIMETSSTMGGQAITLPQGEGVSK